MYLTNYQLVLPVTVKLKQFWRILPKIKVKGRNNTGEHQIGGSNCMEVLGRYKGVITKKVDSYMKEKKISR